MKYTRKTISYDCINNKKCQGEIVFNESKNKVFLIKNGERVKLSDYGKHYVLLDKLFNYLTAKKNNKQKNIIIPISDTCRFNCKFQICSICSKFHKEYIANSSDINNPVCRGKQLIFKGNEPFLTNLTINEIKSNSILCYTKGIETNTGILKSDNIQTIGLEIFIVPGEEQKITNESIVVNYDKILQSLKNKNIILYVYIIKNINETIIDIAIELLKKYSNIKAIVFEAKINQRSEIYSQEEIFFLLKGKNFFNPINLNNNSKCTDKKNTQTTIYDVYNFQYLFVIIMNLCKADRCYYNYTYIKYKQEDYFINIENVFKIPDIYNQLKDKKLTIWLLYKILIKTLILNFGFILKNSVFIFKKIVGKKFHNLADTNTIIPIGINSECVNKNVFDIKLAKFCATGIVCSKNKIINLTSIYEMNKEIRGNKNK